MQIFGVGELAQYIRQYLWSNHVLRDVWVEGKIASLTRASSGHYYFTVRDDRSQLPCVMFRAAAQWSRHPASGGNGNRLHRRSLLLRDWWQAPAHCRCPLSGPLGTGEPALRSAATEARERRSFRRDVSVHYRSSLVEFGVVTSDSGPALHDVLT